MRTYKLFRGKNFNESLLKGLSEEVPDIILVKRGHPPKNAQSKASRLCFVCKRYFSWNIQPGGEQLDRGGHPWTQERTIEGNREVVRAYASFHFVCHSTGEKAFFKECVPKKLIRHSKARERSCVLTPLFILWVIRRGRRPFSIMSTHPNNSQAKATEKSCVHKPLFILYVATGEKSFFFKNEQPQELIRYSKARERSCVHTSLFFLWVIRRGRKPFVQNKRPPQELIGEGKREVVCAHASFHFVNHSTGERKPFTTGGTHPRTHNRRRQGNGRVCAKASFYF